jgi:hypothetical protein
MLLDGTGQDRVERPAFVLAVLKFRVLGEISGFHGGEYEDGCLLGCCAV